MPRPPSCLVVCWLAGDAEREARRPREEGTIDDRGIEFDTDTDWKGAR
jgi:hypothetical protein